MLWMPWALDPYTKAHGTNIVPWLPMQIQPAATATPTLCSDMMYAAAFRAPFRLDIAGGIL
jgi:hypothetical protein